MKYSLTAFRKLIIEAFDDEELTIFCSDYFSEVNVRFSSGMSKQMKAHELVTHCSRHEQLGTLEEKLKTERSEKYEKYKDELRLKSDEETPSALEEIRAGASEYADVFEAMKPPEPARQHITTELPLQETTHPLAGDLQAVKQWFLQELDRKEQVFVMTAALFSGLERQELMEIYRDVSTILQPAETQADKEDTA